MNENPFNITREEVLELAAQKLADSVAAESDLHDTATTKIRERVETVVSTIAKSVIEQVLTKEMEALLSKEIMPVDLWGEPTGKKPTSIRDQLTERAKDFWNTSVDESGKESSWGGRPRYEQLFKKIVNEEFCKAVKDNVEIIVGEFKQALKADAATITAKHIDELIKTKRR